MSETLISQVSEAARGSDVLARLDRLPVLRTHIIWIMLIAINMMIEYYDNGLNIPLATELPRDPASGVAPEAVGNVISAFYAGMIAGAVVGGRLADRFGRRRVLIWGTVLYSLSSLMTAALPHYDFLLASRFVTGVGVQAVTSALVMYIAELFPSAKRGRFVAVSTISFTVTAPILAALAVFILPGNPPGAWRILPLVGALGLLVVPFVRILIPESPRWLVANGRIDEAEKIARRLEDEARSSGKHLAPFRVASMEAHPEYTFRQLMTNPALIRVIAVVGFGWFGATLGLYLYQNFMVDVLYELHLRAGSDETSALDSSYLSYLIWSSIYVITPVITFVLISVLERKTLILLASVASGIAISFMGFGTIAVYNVAAAIATVLTGVVFSAYYAYIPEVVPTEARGLASGIIFGIGRTGAMITGLLFTALYYPSPKGIFGFDRLGVMLFAAGAYLIAGVVVMVWGPRTAKRSLEEVTSSEILRAS